MTPSIFVSYRREDAAGEAGRLTDHLHRRFGAGRVFLDVDTIEPGRDFVRALRASLEQTAVMLVVIGARWASLRAADGTRRLDAADDFVRMEVEAALARDIPVVPVLVQGAAMPRAADVPPSLAPLLTRQAVTLDHAEFHDDAERLCDRIAPLIPAGDAPDGWQRLRRWWPAAALAAVVAIGLAAYAVRSADVGPPPVETVETAVPDAAQRAREDAAMEAIRNASVRSGQSFGDAIKADVAVVDAALAAATGVRRADLLAHAGWARFLMWRDGNRELDPAARYREALAIDPQNPYANAMLAHWMLMQDGDVPRAAALFATALASGRAIEAVRALQWGAYANAGTPAADVERLRLADAMRRNGETLTAARRQALWNPYYFALSRDEGRNVLLGALPPDDHLATLTWAFDAYTRDQESRGQTVRYYAALLHARAGRAERAAEALRALDAELAGASGSLPDAVRKALAR